MTSTFTGIETSLRGLFAGKAALNTTGHNISNANTPGYTRQVVNQKASLAIDYPGFSSSAMPGQLGTGVTIDSITRLRQSFQDSQYRNQNQSYGSWQTQWKTLDTVQSILNEPSTTGLNTSIQNFWKAWSGLSENPQSLAARTVVQQDAQALTESFHSLSRNLTNLSSDLTDNINTNANQVNTLTSQIAGLNVSIQKIEAFGTNNANDLRDQRDLLTDKLSKLVNIKVQDSSQGYNIKMGNISLVTGKQANQMTASSLASAKASGDLTGGEIYGMFVSRDNYVASYQKQLDNLANTLANGNVQVTIPAGSVIPSGTVVGGKTYTGTVAQRTLSSNLTAAVKGINGLHQLGYTLAGPLQKGQVFFQTNDGSSTIAAGNIVLNPTIAANAANVASSMRTTLDANSNEVVVQGNNSLASVMAQLQNSNFTFTAAGSSSSSTVNDFMNATVGQIGVQDQQAKQQMDNQQMLLNQIDSARQSVSGVSLDQEMSNMVKYQQAYAASARIMSTIDQTFTTLLQVL